MAEPAVAPAPSEPTPVLKEEAAREYIVKKGDSLSVIAKNHNVSKSELADLNKITDPNKIRVGQKLIIPGPGHAAAVPAAKAPKAQAGSKPKARKIEPTPSLAAGIDEYVVAAGDSLSKIAAKCNVKVSELREVNKLVSDKIKTGQKLIIPGAKKEPAAPATEPAAAAAPETEPAKPEAAPAAATPPPEASPAAAPAPAAAPGSGITHVVSPSEDLSSIAKLYAVTVDDIVAANQMGTNRTVQAGQKITIP
jgi:LysM repeat protein